MEDVWFCRNNRERLRGSLTWQASKCQGIELVSGGRGFVFVAIERLCRNKEIEGGPYATCSVSTLIKLFR
jgi:hypothetical protein